MVTVMVCTGAWDTDGVVVIVRVVGPLGPELEPLLLPQAVMVMVPTRAPAKSVAMARVCTIFLLRRGNASNSIPARPRPPPAPVNEVSDGQVALAMVVPTPTNRVALAD